MGCLVDPCSSTGPPSPSPPTTAVACVVVAAALRGLACLPPSTMEAHGNHPPSYSETGLEDIFDEKFKAFTSLDYNDYGPPTKPQTFNNDTIHQSNNNAINGTHYNIINGTSCNAIRSSPPPKGRSSPSLVMPHRPSPQYANNPKPDPWACNNIPNNTPFDMSDLNPLAIKTSLNVINGSSTRPGTPSMMGCEASLSPKRLSSPNIKSKVLANRDKESLMDEIIGLKKAYLDQSASLQRQKVHATNLESENRKLEKELEEIELQGNVKGSIRPGSPSRLRAKVQGLKARVAQLEATCEGQAEELQILRRDMRVTRTRELEAERDIFAEEIERLQSFVRRLKGLQNRLSCENKQLSRYKDRTAQLEAANQRLETSVTELQKSLEKANKENFESTRRGNESTLRAKRAERQCQDLQGQLAYVTAVLEKEKSEKVSLQQMVHILQEEVQTLQSSQHSVSSKSNKARTNLSSSDQGHRQDDDDDAEDNNLGILAKTWGFLHHSKPRHSAQKAVNHHQLQAEEVDYEKMLGLPKRPETRGEPRSRSLLTTPPNNSSLSNGLVFEKPRPQSPSKTSSSVGRRFSADSGPRLPTPPHSREASDVASSAMLYADHSTPQSSSTQPSSSINNHHHQHHQFINNRSERGYQSDHNYDQCLGPESILTATHTQTADKTVSSSGPSSASTSEPMAPQVVTQASLTQVLDTAVLSSSTEDTTLANTSSSLLSGSSTSTADPGELDPVRRVVDAATARIQEDLLQATRDGAGSRREDTSSSSGGGGEGDGEGGAGGKAHQFLVPKLNLEQVGGKTQESNSGESAIQTSASTRVSYTQKSGPLNGDTSQERLQPP